ncbi:MAG: class I SAM-dependent methyltransferase [bacterium]
MTEFDFKAYQAMVKDYQNRDDPLGWFDSIYQQADGDHTAVFWADLTANPYLVKWFEEHLSSDKTAIAIGCGVGDDAEALAQAGYQVTAFDISPTAIELCKARYPDTRVNYLVADLFDHSHEWLNHFDLVYECNTIQVLPGQYRIKAMNAMLQLLAKKGHLLVSCRSRKHDEQLDAIPLPLDHEEINYFVRSGLKECCFIAYDDDQQPPVPHFFADYQKI